MSDNRPPRLGALRRFVAGTRRFTSGIPLRIKLVAAVLSLVSVALLLTGFAGTALLRRYLLDRVDSQLVNTAHFQVERLQYGQLPGPRGSGEGDEAASRNFYLQVSDPSGVQQVRYELVPYGGTSNPPQLPRMTPHLVATRSGRPFTVDGSSGGHWRVLVSALPDGSSVTVAVSLADVDSTVDRLVRIDLLIGLLILVLLAGVGYLVVRGSLRRLETVETTAEAIAAGDLTRRVPVADERTEVGRLGRAFNLMVGRIEAAFRDREAAANAARASEERMRRFVADASHELRTPLTSIRGFAELHRQGAVTAPADVDRVMERIEGEATRMGLLVEDLLLLARLDEQRPLERKPVDLLALAADAVHDARAQARTMHETCGDADDGSGHGSHDVQLVVEPGSTPPVVLGDEARLRQVVGNLVTNALTHTPAGTSVRVSVGARPGWALLSVADDGPGMPAEQAAHVFERFYRADSARTRSTGGAGLGLSIVAALVRAHGGRVDVQTAPGEGATFRVWLPLQQPDGG